MSIQAIALKNFRCFKQATFEFTAGDGFPAVTIIQGSNGSGKTSILEALHYGCYLRSFRTHVPLELCHDTSSVNGFSIQITSQTDTISIGVAGKKRVIKLNGTPLKSYNELIQLYKVVGFIEDDLQAIKGYPEVRRSLIDNALFVHEPQYHSLIRSLRKVVEQRTRILQDHSFHQEQYQIWTDQLITVSDQIIGYRKAYLEELSKKIIEIKELYDAKSDNFLTMVYREKRTVITPEDRKKLLNDELRAQRNLYGPHLDDIEFLVHERSGRSFASRGQQKLAIMLLKIAQAHLLLNHNGSIIFLIDDFLTDFDEIRVKKLLKLFFELQAQLIITTPQPNALLYSMCQKYGNLNLIVLDSTDLEHINRPSLDQKFQSEI